MEIRQKLLFIGCGYICTDLDIPIAGRKSMKEKEELKNLSKWGKFFFYVIIDREIFSYLKNKK